MIGFCLVCDVTKQGPRAEVRGVIFMQSLLLAELFSSRRYMVIRGFRRSVYPGS